jgi:O-acetyl-ADP-ribose deacetylase (regulator of RNase III)
MMRSHRVGNGVLVLEKGDITHSQVDAIVNAANEALVLGGGVAGAILRAGGSEIQEECLRRAPIRTGEAVITTGGRLPARHVIHAVGPRGGDPDADALLEKAVLASLRVAEDLGLRSIAFPAISTGIFGYPLGECARRMTRIAADWLAHPKPGLTEIRIVLFEETAFTAFSQALDSILDSGGATPRPSH